MIATVLDSSFRLTHMVPIFVQVFPSTSTMRRKQRRDVWPILQCVYRCIKLPGTCYGEADMLVSVIQDYELALEMLRLARSDFKSDNANAQTAGCAESSAVCLLMLEGSRREQVSFLNVLLGCGCAYVV